MDKWDNPECISENRMASHTWFQEDSISLNGNWRFLYVNGADPVPDQFFSPSYSSKHWNKIIVPSSWEKAGYAHPYFYNKELHPALSLKSHHAPQVNSDKNARGIYRKRFSIDESWCRQKVVLRFSAVSSLCSVWLNGSYVGTSKGSITAVEFDISQLVKPGYNYLCVQVLRFSDSSFLDSRGYWIQSGIIGDVDVYALPIKHIKDLYAKTSFGDTLSDAVTHVTLECEHSDGMTARIAIMEDQRVCYYGEGIIADGRAQVTIACPSPKLWSADHPHLYKLAVILWDGVAICHTRQIDFGFRKISIERTAFEINGVPAIIKGVCYNNRTPSSFLQDIQKIKACNINAIRVKSPVDESLYQLCDQYGLYVLDDCSTAISSTAWDLLYSQRSEELMLTHRNHPSVILWNICSGKNAVYQMDATRPVCGEDFYCVESAGIDRIDQMDQLETISEKNQGLMGLLTPPTVILAETYRDFPLLALSYGGATGNHAGKLIKICDIFRKSKHWAGGFFYQWIDQDDIPDSPRESAQGLLAKSGIPHHSYYELQKGYQWIRCKRYDDGTIRVKNHYPFLNTSSLLSKAVVTRDGNTISEEILNLDIPPRETLSFKPKLPESMYQPGIYHLNLTFSEKNSSNKIYAYFQWELCNNKHVYDLNPGGVIRDDGGHVILKAENISYLLNRNTGNIDQIRYKNKDYLKKPISPAFYRVKTDSEQAVSRRPDEWEKMTLKNQMPKPSVFEVDHMSHQVVVSQNVASGLNRRYQLFKDGTLLIEMRIRTGKTAPNRIGLQTELSETFTSLRWLGLGPWDTYEDRKDYGWFGSHHQTVLDQDLFYRPQESGNKMEVREACVESVDGIKLLLRSEEGMECSLLPSSLDELEHGIITPEHITLNMNAIQDGLNEKVILPHHTTILSFTLKPEIF